jgi:hypothetical protein
MLDNLLMISCRELISAWIDSSAGLQKEESHPFSFDFLGFPFAS